MFEAQVYKQLQENKVQCLLCSHFCVLSEKDKGLCGVRQNRQGQLISLVGYKVAALNLDPVEKKPLFHFLPTTKTLSLGASGCNFKCTFCQNANLSQSPKVKGLVQGQKASPEYLVSLTREHFAPSISYTYSEPTVFFELMYDTAQKAVEAGLKNIMVSNGFQSPNCLKKLQPFIHAANIDLKAFTNNFYQDYCGGRLQPVLDNLVQIKKMGWWLEVTTLLIPGLNDNPEELKQLARFIMSELGHDTPWHISRFHPCYKMQDRPPTPLQSLERAFEIGKQAGLDYVYLGNVPGHGKEDTLCPKCNTELISRQGFQSEIKGLKDNKCKNCGHILAGILH